MEVFQARLDSFLKAKRVRPSSGTGYASIKWPHPSHFIATPNSLAEAGFYFCPTWDERDAVKCYLCGKELGDWLKDDDPFAIHWDKCRTSCPWAIVRCGLQLDIDRDGNFVFSDPTRAPSSDQMSKARLETFAGWPHDSHQAHGATSERMAVAGFVYTPQSNNDDTATCLHCNIALSGWEIDDDPLQEHRKRDEKSKSRCPFLSNQSAPMSVKVPPRSRSRSKKLKPIPAVSQSIDSEKTSPIEDAPKANRAKRKGNLNTISNKDEKPELLRRSTRITSSSQASIAPALAEEPNTEAEEEKPAARKKQTKGQRKTKKVAKKQKSDDFEREQTPEHLSQTTVIIPPSPLSATPVNNILSVTEKEMEMTVEEWIRHEMALQYDLFKADGEGMIRLFKERTDEPDLEAAADTFQIRDLEALKQFSFDRLLNEDPVTLLGTFPKNINGPVSEQQPAILRIEKVELSAHLAHDVCQSLLERVQLAGSNDIYTWFFGWFGPERDKDVKIFIISPATQVHVRKYTAQTQLIVRETPALYERIVKPYIDAFPLSRTQWVKDILSGKAESHNILYDNPCQNTGFVILPDMKWDLTTLSSLYLVAITRSEDISCLRDLRKKHLGMLREIRRETARIVKEKWNFELGMTRLFIHYQPSYYHFHVHIVNANMYGIMGMVVGQAHLLDDVISLLELDPDDEHSVFERMTLTYGLGDQHGLFSTMNAAQAEFANL